MNWFLEVQKEEEESVGKTDNLSFCCRQNMIQDPDEQNETPAFSQVKMVGNLLCCLGHHRKLTNKKVLQYFK